MSDIELQYWTIRRLIRLTLIIGTIFFAICMWVDWVKAECHYVTLYAHSNRYDLCIEDGYQDPVRYDDSKDLDSNVWASYYRWLHEEQDHDIIDDIEAGIDGD